MCVCCVRRLHTDGSLIYHQMKPAFSYACEGSATVSAGNSRTQPISIGSSSSSSTRPVPVQGNSRSNGAGLSRPAPAVVANGSSSKQAAPIWTAAPSTKGKERARRFEEIQDEDGDVSRQLNDSGFVETSSSVKRVKAGPSNGAQVRLFQYHVIMLR